METKAFMQEMDATRDDVERDAPLPRAKEKEIRKRKNPLFDYIEKRKAKGNVTVEALLSIGFLALGFLFSKTVVLFGAIPLGIGLISARRQRLPEMGLGMALGLFSMGSVGLVYGLATLFALGLRLMFSYPKKESRFLPQSPGYFSEAPELRVTAALVTGVLLFGYQVLAGGFSVAALQFGIATVVLTPLSTLAFYLAFENAPAPEAVLGIAPIPDQTPKEAMLWKVGMLLTLGALVFSLAGVELFGISLSLALVSALAFFAGKRFGGLWGMVTGLALGGVVLPLYAPAFGLAGLVSGVLWPLGGFFALGLGVAGGTVWSAFVGELTGFLTVFPELSMVAVLLLPLLKKVKREGAEPGLATAGQAAEAICFVETPSHTKGEEDMLSLSSTLGGLAKLYRHFVSDLSAPQIENSVASAIALCAKRCQGCAHQSGCWGKAEGENAPLEQYITALVDRLYRKTGLEGLTLPEVTKNACAVPDAILEDARTAVGEAVLLGKGAKEDPYPTLEYEVASAMMRDIVRQKQAKEKDNPKAKEGVMALLKEQKISYGQVSVKGQKSKAVLVSGLYRKPSEETLAALHQGIETVCGGKFSPFLVEHQGDGWYLFCTNRKKYTAETAVVMRSATPDQVSGDTVRYFEREDGSFCVLLSDGMGSGRGAAAVSGLCVSFLEKLLSAGCHRTTAVKLMNQTVRSLGEVGSTTLDMAELDLLHGEAVFLKAGAAASYVKRGTQLFRIRSKTIPLGLLKTPDTEKTRFSLEAGDVVILLSDGISQMPEDSTALCSVLAADWGEESLSESAGHILSAALSSGERADDMTVVLVRIGEEEAG